MLLDIHTHRNAAVPGECIFNVEPAWFEPVEGCYYSVGIHPWKVWKLVRKIGQRWKRRSVIPLFWR